MKMLEKLKDKINKNNVLTSSKIKIQFCANNEDVQSPTDIFLPIMMHMCPPNFSTVDYFEVNSSYISNNCAYLEFKLIYALCIFNI